MVVIGILVLLGSVVDHSLTNRSRPFTKSQADDDQASAWPTPSKSFGTMIGTVRRSRKVNDREIGIGGPLHDGSIDWIADGNHLHRSGKNELLARLGRSAGQVHARGRSRSADADDRQWRRSRETIETRVTASIARPQAAFRAAVDIAGGDAIIVEGSRPCWRRVARHRLDDGAGPVDRLPIRTTGRPSPASKTHSFALLGAARTPSWRIGSTTRLRDQGNRSR